MNPKIKEQTKSYNSFTKFNDFLNESKEKAEEFIKEKLKSLLGHSLELKLNILASDSNILNLSSKFITFHQNSNPPAVRAKFIINKKN